MRDDMLNWRAQRLRGFSLVELITVLSIALVLLTIGIPGFRTLIQGQRMTTTVNDFFFAINLARTEAIQRGARVDLVPKDIAGDWAKGWIVFIDENDNQQADAGERVIFSHDPVPQGLTIKSTLTDSNTQYLAYTGVGRTRTNASSAQTQFGTLTFQLEKQTRKIKLNFLGRPRICNPETEYASC